MKRQGNLIEKIADRDNLTRAFLRANTTFAIRTSKQENWSIFMS